MNPEIESIFNAYKKLRNEADILFSHISSKFPECVTCHKGCSDCCHAVFDLSLIEAMYINKSFTEKFDYGRIRSDILERASTIDRTLTRIKRDLFRAEKAGEKPENLIAQTATIRIRCPLLDDNNDCLLYDSRPITCRLYGIPIDISGNAHVCGLSKFDKGHIYPTVKLEKIQKRLEELSSNLANTIGTSFEFDDVYVPLSMALLTKYDDTYFGKDNN